MSEGPTDGGIEPRARANSVESDPRAQAGEPAAQQILSQNGGNLGQAMHPLPTRMSSLSPEPPSQSLTRSNSSSSQISSHVPSQGIELRARPSHSSSRRLEPPVTKATLSELDVHKIIHNPKLRHDINFDPELHFRPNLDGEKGRRKTEKANQFWDTLEEQLEHFTKDPETFYREFGHREDWCLPQLLTAIKEIIQTLVPQRDRDFLDEGLHVGLLMQQFYKGVADLEKMASWIRRVLKLHCAPMRDDWVDRMYEELSQGNREMNMSIIVSGLRSLLSLLEAMKLDVANHQIRCLRSLLIEDTVAFEQRFFIRRVQAQRLKRMPEAQQWYSAASQQDLSSVDVEAFGENAPFFSALARLILPSTPAEFVPETFVFDEERIIKLRSDAHDSICLEVCMRLYEDLEKVSRLTHHAQLAEDEMCNFAGADTNYFAPASRPSSLALSSSGSDMSSPRNSSCFIAQGTDEAGDSRTKARNLYHALLALLQTVPPTSSPYKRWRDLLEPIADEISRFVHVPQDIYVVFQKRLEQCLTNPCDDGQFARAEAHFYNRLLNELGKRVKEFQGQSLGALFSLATGSRINTPGRQWDSGRDNVDMFGSANGSGRDLREDGGVEDMATRLAHLGILHWRVWGPFFQGGNAEVQPSSTKP